MNKLVQASWRVGILVLAVLLVAACGRRPTETPSPASLPPTSTQAPATPTPASTATPVPPPPTPTLTNSPTTAPSPPPVPDTPTATAAVSAVVATGDGVLNVRGGPGTDYPILGKLEPGAQVTLLARSADGTWFEIVYPAGSDGRGWLSGEFLQMQGAPDQLPVAQAPATSSPTPAPTAPPSVTATPAVTGTLPISGTVSAVVATGGGALNVRGGPGTDYPILGKLEPGAQVTLLARSADGTWFEIVYPASSDGRGWLSGEFLQIQGAPDQLPVAQASPGPAATPTPATVEACAPIPGQSYGTLAITSAPTDRPAESNADLNLGLRGYAPVDVPKALIELSGATDPNAPQLRGLFADQRVPTVTGTYQVYNWDWGTNSRGALITSPEVTLLGLQTTTGEIIHAPDTGRDLGEGYVAMVLYATQSRITLKYTRDDNVVAGYTVHIEKVCVEPTLQALYEKMNEAGRLNLPALRPGQPLGRATGAEIDVAIRDDGSFLDPRSAKDWWSQP
jgi:uncharacterized protein YraI